MEVHRTVCVKLALDAEDRCRLHETIEQFRRAPNYVVEQARREEGRVITDRRRLHDRTYQAVREQTELHANHVQAARNCAADALSSVVAKWQVGKRASMPTFTAPFIEYDKRSATFHDDHASLATVDGRIEVRYVLPDAERETPHAEYLESDDYEITGASLHYREPSDEFSLHLRTMAELDDPDPPENGTVLGVDLEVEHIAVTSTGVFWSGAELNHGHREYERRRASLQQCGSRDARENMQAVGRQETGRFEQLLHRVANGIVEDA